MKEEDRLKAVIAIIDEESRIVPRGAYIKTPTGQVKINRSFEGQFIFKKLIFIAVLKILN